jgi:hypothetical protein
LVVLFKPDCLCCQIRELIIGEFKRIKAELLTNQRPGLAYLIASRFRI